MASKSAVIELEAEAPAPNGTHGHRPKVRTRRIVADQAHWSADLEEQCPMWPDEGVEPFWAEVRANLTFDDIAELAAASSFANEWAVMSPWVVAWNATAWDQESKTWQPVPPPAEIGPDAFKTQPREYTSFIALCLQNNRLGTDLPKESKPSVDTDGG